jgi:hypothetical protein
MDQSEAVRYFRLADDQGSEAARRVYQGIAQRPL